MLLTIMITSKLEMMGHTACHKTAVVRMHPFLQKHAWGHEPLFLVPYMAHDVAKATCMILQHLAWHLVYALLANSTRDVATHSRQ